MANNKNNNIENFIDGLSSFKNELINLRERAYKLKDIHTAKEKIDRWEERVISFIKESKISSELEKFNNISYPRNVNWRVDFNNRYNAKISYLEALIEELKINPDFWLESYKNKSEEKKMVELSNGGDSTNGNRWSKYLSIVISAVFFAAGLLFKEFSPIVIFGSPIGIILFILSLLAAFIFLILFLVNILRQKLGKKHSIKPNIGAFIVIIILVCILVLMPYFIVSNYTSAEIERLKKIETENATLEIEMDKKNIELEDLNKKYIINKEISLDLKNIALGIEDSKYFDLRNNYIIQFPDNEDWIIDYEWSSLNWMIFLDKSNKTYAKIRVIRYDAESFKNAQHFTEQRYPNVNEKEGKIVEGMARYFTLSDIINVKIDSEDAAKIIFNAYWDPNLGNSKPYYSHGESYQVLHLEENKKSAYVITLECFGDNPDYSDAKNLFNQYKNETGVYEYIINNIIFSTRDNFYNKFQMDTIIKTNSWGIAISSDENIEGALDEVKDANALGYSAVIYKKDEHQFDTFIGPFVEWNSADNILLSVKNELNSKAFLVNLRTYCKGYIQRELFREYFEN